MLTINTKNLTSFIIVKAHCSMTHLKQQKSFGFGLSIFITRNIGDPLRQGSLAYSHFIIVDKVVNDVNVIP